MKISAAPAVQTTGAMKGMWAQPFCDALKTLRWDFVHEAWHDADDFSLIANDVKTNGRKSGWYDEWNQFIVPNKIRAAAHQEGSVGSGMDFIGHHHGMMLAAEDIAAKNGIGDGFHANLSAWLPKAGEAPAAFATRLKTLIEKNMPKGASKDGIDAITGALSTLADDSKLSAFTNGDALGIFIQTDLGASQGKVGAGYHNTVHNLLSNGTSPGDMGDPSKNIYNPLFYAHHGLIDYFVTRYYSLKHTAPDAAQFTQLASAAQQAMEVVPTLSANAKTMAGCSMHYAAAANPNAQAHGVEFWKALAKTKR